MFCWERLEYCELRSFVSRREPIYKQAISSQSPKKGGRDLPWFVDHLQEDHKVSGTVRECSTRASFWGR